jgi:hypothetical protein
LQLLLSLKNSLLFNCVYNLREASSEQLLFKNAAYQLCVRPGLPLAAFPLNQLLILQLQILIQAVHG